jgi:hypothetical protein
MPIIINELHTDLTEPAAPDAAGQGAGAATEPAVLQPDLALQRAAALLAERRARLEDD